MTFTTHTLGNPFKFWTYFKNFCPQTVSTRQDSMLSHDHASCTKTKLQTFNLVSWYFKKCNFLKNPTTFLEFPSLMLLCSVLEVYRLPILRSFPQIFIRHVHVYCLIRGQAALDAVKSWSLICKSTLYITFSEKRNIRIR